MPIRLEFLTEVPEEVALAESYWAIDEDGRFLARVADLVPFQNIRQSSQIAKRVRELCIAFDKNQYCYLCKGPIRVYNRTDVKKTFQNSSLPCASCAEDLSLKKLEQEAREQEEAARLIGELAERNSSVKLNYASLPDDTVIVLLAIDALVEPHLATGTFRITDCFELAPLDSDDLIKRLSQEGYILQDYLAAPPGTYNLQDGELWRKTSQVEFFLPPDKVHGRGASALQLLYKRRFSDSAALIELWLDYSVRDVLRYFIDQCEIYNHSLDDDQLDKIKSTIRYGLHIYSVSQLWSVMWKAVKDAASLANRQYYNRQKAAATIPNKIRKLIEAAERKGGINRGWSRPEHHLAGALGMLFSSLFGIDEDSAGSDVMAFFDRLISPVDATHDQVMYSLAEFFIRIALEHTDPGLIMNDFSDKVKGGLTTEQAMIEIIDQLEDMLI